MSREERKHLGTAVCATETFVNKASLNLAPRNLLLETDGIGGDAEKFYTSTIDEEYGNLLSESGSELYHLPDAQHATNALLDENGEVVARFKYEAFGQAHSASDGSLSTGWSNLTVDDWSDLTVNGWAALPVMRVDPARPSPRECPGDCLRNRPLNQNARWAERFSIHWEGEESCSYRNRH